MKISQVKVFIFDSIGQVNGGLHDHGIDLREGDYRLNTKEMEFEARDHYIQSLDDKIKAIKNEPNYNRVIPNTPEARREDDKRRINERRYREGQIKKLEQEKKSIQEMDDIGCSILFDGCLLGGGGLTTGERDTLVQEMRGKK